MCFPEEEEAFHSLENSNEYVLIDTVCALPLQLVLWIILFVWQQKFHADKRQQCNPWYRKVFGTWMYGYCLIFMWC
jgi:hypothetical protein